MFQIASLKLIFTDSTEILFSKLCSAGLSYPLPKLSFFTDPYCAGIRIAYCIIIIIPDQYKRTQHTFACADLESLSEEVQF